MRTSILRRPPFTALAPILVVAVALLAGCGPFGYLKKVAKDASKTVADAKAAGAEQYAPYEDWGAVAYLDQAKVLMAYSEYERSFDYGVRAKQLAEEAKRKADMREAGKTSESLEGGDDAAATNAGAAANASSSAEDGEAKGSIGVGGSVGGGK